MLNLAAEVEGRLRELPQDKELTVAVMGCVVNGPGEAKHADFGIAGGVGEGVLFRHGEIIGKVPQKRLVEALLDMIKYSD